MKKQNIITSSLIILTVLFTIPSYSQDKIEWMSFEEAMALNEENPKHFFIDVYTDWCGWCKKMDASTFVDPVIVELMNEHFYAVKLDAEQKDTIMFQGNTFVNPDPDGRRSSHQMAQALLKGKMSYPSFVFLNTKSEWLTVVAGFRKAPDMEQVLTYFGEGVYEEKSWEQFMITFASDLPGKSAQ
ncbi:MAG: thioredoxin [Bacteroidetes bacterium]|nr:MAG: thioredoxin [Bacteroidota bacterium]